MLFCIYLVSDREIDISSCWPWCLVGDPGQGYGLIVRVQRALRSGVVVLQAVIASGDSSGPPSKGFVIQP